MKLRHLLIIIALLIALSTLAGVGVLILVRDWRLSAITMPSLTATLPPLPTLVTPTVTPTPTNTPTPTPSPTPTPTFTPTSTPTPTPLPAARLALAHRAKRNGDYARARSEFQAVLQNPQNEQEAAEAAYELGVCAYLDGDHAAARELLEQFIRQYPGDHRIGTAHFYLAENLTAIGEYAPAIEHYRQYLERQDVLADLIYTRIGDNNESLGDHEAAIKAYQLALERAPDLGQQYDLREKIALAYSAWGHYDEAITWLQGIVERSKNVYRLARIWYLMGQVYRMAGQEDRALDAFAQAVNGDPRPGYAHAALVALVEAYVEVDEYRRGLIDYYAGSYGAAISAFNRYMKSTPDYNPDAHYYVALCYFNSRSFDLAVKECDQAIALSPTASHWGDMWLIKARSLARLGRDDDAVDVYLRFAQDNPDHPLAPQARWEAAQLREEAERFVEAAVIYTALADEHVNAGLAPAARFRAGLCRYRAGDLRGAEIAWNDLINGYPAAPESLRGRYWLGRMWWQEGEVHQARDILQSLAHEHPRTYYGLRAAHLLANGGKVRPWPTPPANLHFTFDKEAEKQETAAWLRGWTDAPVEGDLTVISPELADDIRFRRGMEMLALGMRAPARDEFDDLRRDLDDPLKLYQLAWTTRELGMYAPSLRATINLVSMAPEDSILEMPRLIQRMAFPVYYSDLVVAECADKGLDPLLVFALIRQESVFDDRAVSWAGAVGLTQIIPSTGRWIAEMTGWANYDDTLLTRPYINVKFGTWFLDRILKENDGNVPVALAGYNGGPRNAKHWWYIADRDPDLFVELIDSAEATQYVRQIYRHYDLYGRLYGGTR